MADHNYDEASHSFRRCPDCGLYNEYYYGPEGPYDDQHLAVIDGHLKVLDFNKMKQFDDECPGKLIDWSEYV